MLLCKISNKSNESILSNIQKSWFCPTAPPTFAPFYTFSEQKGIFPEKWQHLKCLMVCYLHAKKCKKRLNGSKDIDSNLKNRAIWLSRAFAHKSWEWEFSQIWDLYRKLANHKTLHFRSFLAKTNDSTFRSFSIYFYMCRCQNPIGYHMSNDDILT